MGLRNGSPPAWCRGRAAVGFWGEASATERFLVFKLNQYDKLKVGMFFKVENAKVILVKFDYNMIVIY